MYIFPPNSDPSHDEIVKVFARLKKEGEKDDGSLTWEVKEQPRKGGISGLTIASEAAAFANSQLGGWLVLGISDDLELVGWDFRGEDSRLWSDRVIRSNLNRMPPLHMAQPQKIDGGRHVQPIWIPASLGPYVNKNGQTYTRGHGGKVLLDEIGPLTELFNGADARRQTCLKQASDAANQAWVDLDRERSERSPEGATLSIGWSLGLSALHHPSDMSAVIFTTDHAIVVHDKAIDAAGMMAALKSSAAPMEPRYQHRQDRVFSYQQFGSSEGLTRAALTTSIWDGSAAAAFAYHDDCDTGWKSPDGVIRRLWRASADLLRDVGADGEGRLVVRQGSKELAREISDVTSIDEDMLEKIDRELKRMNEQIGLEPTVK